MTHGQLSIGATANTNSEQTWTTVSVINNNVTTVSQKMTKTIQGSYTYAVCGLSKVFTTFNKVISGLTRSQEATWIWLLDRSTSENEKESNCQWSRFCWKLFWWTWRFFSIAETSRWQITCLLEIFRYNVFAMYVALFWQFDVSDVLSYFKQIFH